MRVNVSLTDRDSETFKRLGGSKWLQQAIRRARAVEVRRLADEAICERLEQFKDEEIRDAISGVEQTVTFQHEGRDYYATFTVSREALAGREGASLANAVDREIRTMGAKIEEGRPDD